MEKLTVTGNIPVTLVLDPESGLLLDITREDEATHLWSTPGADLARQAVADLVEIVSAAVEAKTTVKKLVKELDEINIALEAEAAAQAIEEGSD